MTHRKGLIHPEPVSRALALEHRVPAACVEAGPPADPPGPAGLALRPIGADLAVLLPGARQAGRWPGPMGAAQRA